MMTSRTKHCTRTGSITLNSGQMADIQGEDTNARTSTLKRSTTAGEADRDTLQVLHTPVPLLQC